MLITPTREEYLPGRRDYRIACVRRLSERLQILIVAIAAFAWLCGPSGFVSKAHAGGGGFPSGPFPTPTATPTPSITYIYDAVGRLIAVVNASGNAATYQYDNVGNLLSTSTTNGSQVSIFALSPNNGPVNSSVTIYGDGFSTTASQNTVTFSGQAATVISSTQTTIATTVPTGAVTGSVTVTAPAGSATASFTVTQ
jgi:YD repeat-containing protein